MVKNVGGKPCLNKAYKTYMYNKIIVLFWLYNSIHFPKLNVIKIFMVHFRD